MKLRLVSVFLLALVAESALHADHHNTYPLPEDRGTAGTYAALKKLPVYAHALYTTAHPDDESAGTLTWLAREMHASTVLFCLTRGEGGQNLLGDEKYEAMGLVRTGELLEACRIYGVEPYFSTAFEFGFSKSAEETFAKWGHDAVLEEMVRFIRRYRPSVIISAFRGDSSDGHGHHQAAGILTREAFRSAGDPQRFPEQLKAGLLPWQAKKLYLNAGRGSSGGDGVLSVPVGDYDAVLGRSAREIGAEGYSKHQSQGNGAVVVLPGRAYDHFRLADSTVSGEPNEKSFFDSIDTSLSAILELAGGERDRIAFLANDLAAAGKSAEDALAAFHHGRQADCAAGAAKGSRILGESLRKIERSSLSKNIREALTNAIREKQEDFGKAVTTVLGVYTFVRADDPTAIEGEKIPVTISFFNRGPESIELKEIRLQTAQGTNLRLPPAEPVMVAAGEDKVVTESCVLPKGEPVTQPFWYRENASDNRYHTRPTPDPFAPFGPPALSAQLTYCFHQTDFSLVVPVTAQAGNPLRGSDFVDLQIVPALSVALQPSLAILPLSRGAQSREFQISVLDNNKAGALGTIRLVAPPGWRVEPREIHFALSRKGETFTARFTLNVPAVLTPGAYTVQAFVNDGVREYQLGYRVISYPENWTRNLYSPARSVLRAFDVKIAPDLTVGYVPGAGDDVPAALEQLGVHVEKLSAGDLAYGDLGRFNAIVTGIRAYNVNEDLRANNQRLLKYVEQGGTLIVQYVRPLGRSTGGGAGFPYGPYPMSNSDEARITMEESPVEMLDPGHPLLNKPNRITAGDFDGWVQERGLYFMTQWDPRYTALLSGHDPGEPPQKGGMLIGQYGKGYYVYSAYAWFRQLPSGVPGAYRIFANMLSLGKSK